VRTVVTLGVERAHAMPLRARLQIAYERTAVARLNLRIAAMIGNSPHPFDVQDLAEAQLEGRICRAAIAAEATR
jgi:hypothetical protein